MSALLRPLRLRSLPSRTVRPSVLSCTKRGVLRSLHISAGEDAAAVTRAAESLVAEGKWRVTRDECGLERTLRFKGFKSAWLFMTAVAAACKRQRHHPEWTNVYNKVHVRWTTHDPRGLSSKDVDMARFTDAAAGEHGEVPATEEQRAEDERAVYGGTST